MPEALANPAVDTSPAPRVAVVGGGPAGLTSALKLAQAGYSVTLYEAKETLGGNISSRQDPVTGLYHDVYPHLFCSWYNNLWDILENDLGLARRDNFAPRMGVKVLDKPNANANEGAPNYIQLFNATTLETIWSNLNSGVLPFPDMFLIGYSMLDIAGHPRVGSGSEMVDKLDVNGFIYSRGYSTEDVAQLQDYILKVIWSIPSTLTAATSYQDFIKHTLAFPRSEPFSWLLQGSLQKRIIQPWAEKLDALGCAVSTGCKVEKVELINDRPRLTLGDGQAAVFDYVVLAVPGAPLADLVITGEPGQRLVDKAPMLSQIKRAMGEAIPVVALYFKKKFTQFPNETVGLRASTYDLSLIDISQLWTGDEAQPDRTVLIVAASSSDAIPSADPKERAFLMIQKLHDYIPCFEAGSCWGDDNSDIDWTATNYRSNDDYLLFVDDVGSLEWRPTTTYESLPSVVFAGDICLTDVNMATVEAAVQSGVMAAQAIQSRHPLGAEIRIRDHEIYSDSALLGAKLALMPLAYGATAWSAVVATRQSAKAGPRSPSAPDPETYALMLPLAYTMDWWKTLYWLIKSFDAGPPPRSETAMPDGVVRTDRSIDVASSILMAASEALEAISSRLSAGRDGAGAETSASLAALASRAWTTVKSALAPEPDGFGDPAELEPHRRRWRAKR